MGGEDQCGVLLRVIGQQRGHTTATVSQDLRVSLDESKLEGREGGGGGGAWIITCSNITAIQPTRHIASSYGSSLGPTPKNRRGSEATMEDKSKLYNARKTGTTMYVEEIIKLYCNGRNSNQLSVFVYINVVQHTPHWRRQRCSVGSSPAGGAPRPRRCSPDPLLLWRPPTHHTLKGWILLTNIGYA